VLRAGDLRPLTKGVLATAFVGAFSLLPGPAFALSHGESRPARVAPSTSKSVVVKGILDCSDILGAAGYGGSPLTLSLSSGASTEAVQYPRRMPMPGENGIFGKPVDELYHFNTTIPRDARSTTVRWELTCQDQDGNNAGDFRGSFSIARSATRDICNHGGAVGIVLTPCNPALTDKLGSCAFAIVTATTGSELLDVTSLALDPPKTWQQKLENAFSEVSSPLVGIVLACAPILTRTETTAPGATTTTGASGQWPTTRDDVNTAVDEWLGSDFVLPDWISCDANYCIAGASGTVYVFRTEGGVDQIGTISESTTDAAQALLQLGISKADVAALLAPTG